MLSGPQLLVLQACNDVPGDPAGFVDEAEIADRTRLQLQDVRDCIESLDEKGYVTSARLTDRYKARITADGRQVLRQHRPFPDEPGGFPPGQHPVKVVPKGLRAFDEHDADFFLELLPGPRRADGLPDSIHFWKVRIEEMDLDKTFKVGTVFGPSGCGKTSLVKAGLLPRLSAVVIPICIQATATETESGLLRGVRKHLPHLSGDTDLGNALIAVKEHINRDHRKVLLVIDQFEQWLHANRGQENTELARALSECDGERVQALVMVRDDFSMALFRFLEVLGIDFKKGENAYVIHRFDHQHARKVLMAFGRAYGRLPAAGGDLTQEQKDFLEQALEGLSQDGEVVPVRLALFAEMVGEMVGGRPWTPATLREVGGTEGVGVTFLENTFNSPKDNPNYHPHQKAAQGVLKALLPESGTNIKGHMRSHEELLGSSTYSAHPKAFGDLLRILDSETRLITPIDPEGIAESAEHSITGGKYYQLTHDYLVPSIREWLNRKQKETRRGRTELLLAERASLWNAKPENRHLPSVWEWANIRLLTKKKDWTEPQRKMMRTAGRIRGRQTLVALLIVGMLTWVGFDRYGTLKASDLVASLKTAETADVPAIVKQLSRYRRWADPQLVQLVRSTDDREHLHASLALLPVDASQVDYLFNRLIKIKVKPSELRVLRDAVQTHRSTLTPKLWTVLESAKPDDAGLLPAASALASYDPHNARWESAGGKVSQALVSVSSIYLGDWLEYLTDVRSKLTAPLATIYRDSRSEPDRAQAIDILTDYARDDLYLITNLLMGADPTAYAAFFPIAQEQAAKTLPLFQAEIRKQATSSWDDPPLDPAWTKPDTALAGKIEMGEGMLTERFAFCQTTALDEFLTTAEGLRNSGYRPIRFRPYADGNATRVAAVWTRDGRPWRLAHDQSAHKIREADERNRKEEFIPVDVAADEATTADGKPTNRHTALWVKKAAPGDDAGMAVPASATELQKVQDQFESAGMAPLTLHVIGGDHGLMTYSGVWHKTGTESSVAPQPRTGLAETDLPGVIAQQGGTLIDLGVNAAPRPPGAKERASVALKAAEITLKAKPDDLKARYSRATACMQLGEYRTSIDDLNALIGKAPQFSILFQFRAIAHARLGHKDEAWADLEHSQKSSSTKSSKLYLSAVVAAEVGEGTNQAFEALEAALKNQPKDAVLHYDAARAYALASQAIAKRDQAKGKAHAERAVSVLQAAVRNGYSDYNHMQEDADLDPIRGLPAFAEILKANHLDRQYTVVWSGDVRFEANPIVGLDPTAHLQRCRELESQGYRMVALSVARISPEGPPVTASVWHRPVITEQVKDQLAERQARAAVALLRMGKVDEVLALLQHSPDPRLRSFIVNRLNPLGAVPRVIAAELDRIPATTKPTPGQGQQFMDAVLFHPETSKRRALILALGTYGTEGLSPNERERLIVKLLDLYRNDPDAGIHGAVEWTLRQRGQQDKLKEVDAQLMKVKDWGDCRWFVNSQGQTFAVIDGPVEFRMGSPPTEPDRIANNEIPHRRIIPRRFAIAAKEVTVEEYQEFVKENPGVDHAVSNRYSPDQKGPMNGVSWYHAAAYCNWLSRKEGKPECYEPNSEGQYAEGMTIRADALQRVGYRLPTEAEWEYACRAGAGTSRYYGSSVDLLGRYAWNLATSPDRAQPCGRWLPNDLGLFDILGNVYEWCQDRMRIYHPDRNGIIVDDINMKEYINNPRLLRGGAFYYPPAGVRSARRIVLRPSDRDTGIGFRPSRTYD